MSTARQTRPPPPTCAGAVVEVDVGHLHLGRQRGGVHGKVVVLGADLNAACARGPGFRV